MIFQHTHQAILAGRKTQTRRLKTAGHTLVRDAAGAIVEVRCSGRRLWRVGQTLAVSPGRGKRAIGRIRLTAILVERVQAISSGDADAEGFASREDFARTWRVIHGPTAWESDPEVFALKFELAGAAASR